MSTPHDPAPPRSSWSRRAAPAGGAPREHGVRGAAERPLRLIQVGAGLMGNWWLRTLAPRADVEVVGVADLNPDAARASLDAVGLTAVPVARTFAELGDVGAEALLDATVPAAHHRVNTEALFAGLPVLSEKPLAERVSECLSMAAAAEVTGKLLMVSQSRRYFRSLAALRRQLARLGALQTITCHFSREVHLDGFRTVMPEPLVVDMAIHQLDLSRLLTGSEPVAVYCESHNPAWSWFEGNATAHVVVEFADGVRFSFTGTFVGMAMETSWNGDWRFSATGGSAAWDGDHEPVAVTTGGEPIPAEVGDEPEEIEGSLAEFLRVLRTGATPQAEAHSNTVSIAMVEAAVRSAAEHRRVGIAEVLQDGYAEALRVETRPEVRDALASWPSVQEAVGLADARV